MSSRFSFAAFPTLRELLSSKSEYYKLSSLILLWLQVWEWFFSCIIGIDKKHLGHFVSGDWRVTGCGDLSRLKQLFMGRMYIRELFPSTSLTWGMVYPLLGMEKSFSGLDVPPLSARISSKAASCDLNLSYSLSSTSLKCWKSPFLFGKTTFFLPSSASFNKASASCDRVLSCSVSESKQKSCVHDSSGWIMKTAFSPVFHFPFFGGTLNLLPPPEVEGNARLVKNKNYNLIISKMLYTQSFLKTDNL